VVRVLDLLGLDMDGPTWQGLEGSK